MAPAVVEGQEDQEDQEGPVLAPVVPAGPMGVPIVALAAPVVLALACSSPNP